MSKLAAAMVAAGFTLGLNVAIAKDTTTNAPSKTWKEFQGQLKKCDTLTGDQKEQCMTQAKEAYRTSNFNCDTLSAQDKSQCQQYGEQWKNERTNQSQDETGPVRSGEANPIPANPADPTDELRNRDSRKQHGDAASALPEPQKQN